MVIPPIRLQHPAKTFNVKQSQGPDFKGLLKEHPWDKIILHIPANGKGSHAGVARLTDTYRVINEKLLKNPKLKMIIVTEKDNVDTVREYVKNLSELMGLDYEIVTINELGIEIL